MDSRARELRGKEKRTIIHSQILLHRRRFVVFLATNDIKFMIRLAASHLFSDHLFVMMLCSKQ